MAMEGWQIANLLGTLIISGSTLGALGIITWGLVKRRGSLGKGDMTRLSESIGALHESVEGMRDELGDLSDRLEFTERVLTRVAEGQKAGDKHLSP